MNKPAYADESITTAASRRIAPEIQLGSYGGLNFYRYVGDKPTRYVDPDGLVVVATIRLVGVPLGCAACLPYFYSLGGICMNTFPPGGIDPDDFVPKFTSCMYREMSRLPGYQKASMTCACGLCAWGSAKVIGKLAKKLKPNKPKPKDLDDYYDDFPYKYRRPPTDYGNPKGLPPEQLIPGIK